MSFNLQKQNGLGAPFKSTRNSFSHNAIETFQACVFSVNDLTSMGTMNYKNLDL